MNSPGCVNLSSEPFVAVPESSPARVDHLGGSGCHRGACTAPAASSRSPGDLALEAGVDVVMPPGAEDRASEGVALLLLVVQLDRRPGLRRVLDPLLVDMGGRGQR
jgi:hypothetical protein